MILDPVVIRRDIAERLELCSLDELRVINRVLEGIEIGRESYGPLDIASDHRQWGAELEQELRDALFYMAAELVAREDIKRERRNFDYDVAIRKGLDEIKAVHSMRVIEPIDPIGFDEEPEK